MHVFHSQNNKAKGRHRLLFQPNGLSLVEVLAVAWPCSGMPAVKNLQKVPAYCMSVLQ